MASDTQPTDNIDQKTLKRNVAAFLTDSGGFGGALGFMGYSTVVPSLVMLLTNSEPMVGLVNMLWSGMWLLPQLAAGRWMANRPAETAGLVRLGRDRPLNGVVVRDRAGAET